MIVMRIQVNEQSFSIEYRYRKKVSKSYFFAKVSVSAIHFWGCIGTCILDTIFKETFAIDTDTFAKMSKMQVEMQVKSIRKSSKMM